MNDTPSNRVLTPGLIAIGLGSGLVSAVLFATGTLAARILLLLAPLPIVSAALGWNHRAGLIAAIACSLLLGLLTDSWTALAVAVTTMLPSWWFSFLALLARRDASGQTEWYPLGRLLLWIAGLVGFLTAASYVMAWSSLEYTAYVKFFERLVPVLERMNPSLFQGLEDTQRQTLTQNLASLFAQLLPAMLAAMSVMTTVILLYIGARVVQSSGRLPRPWPTICEAALPRAALPALLLTALGGFLGGFAGIASLMLMAALLMAFSLQGLATIHALTRNTSGRGALLAGLYVLLVLFGGWPIFVIAFTGIIEAIFGLRARQNGRTQPPT